MAPALDLIGSTQRLSLRGYQQDAIDRVLAAADRGIRRQVGVAGVGAGKTVIFVSLAAKLNVRTLIIAHRDELIQQAAEKVRLWWPDADLGIVKAERRDFGAQDVIVASVQSLTPARLARMGSFGLVIVDEFHHVRAPSYGRVLDALRAGKPDGPLLLGVTATPDRADGKGLDAYADEIVFNYDLLWLIRNGYLVDIRAIEVKMANLRLGEVKVRQGDYADGELGAMMTEAHAPWWIVKAWKAKAADRKTLVFMPTVATAEAAAAEFMAQGIRAASVSGAMHVDERRRVLRDFSTGRFQVLTNCQLTTEGYDEPSISCVVMGRPTKSRGLYTQMIGRGTRLYPEKSDCIAEGQRVLTDNGLVPIELVTTAMKVWDGNEFVTHYGAVCRGEQEVITHAGLTATPDHRVWTDDGWQTLGACAERAIPIVVTARTDGTPLREADGHRRGAGHSEGPQVPTGSLHNVWGGGSAGSGGTPVWGPRRVSAMREPALGSEVDATAVQCGQGSMHQPEGCELAQIWSTRDRVSVRDAARHGLMGAEEPRTPQGVTTGPDRQRWPLRPGQPAMVDGQAEHGAHHPAAADASDARLPGYPPGREVRGLHPATTLRAGADTTGDRGEVLPAVAQTKGRVWDLLNAGPLHRFTVEGLLVSNCLVLDVVGDSEKMDLCTAATLVGVERKAMARRTLSEAADAKDAADAAKEAKRLPSTLPRPDADLVTRDVDLFKQGVKPGRVAWAKTRTGAFATSAGKMSVLMEPMAFEQYRVVTVSEKGERAVLAEGLPLSLAQGFADDIVRRNAPPALVDRMAPWRKKKPSEKSLAFAQRLGIGVPDSWTADDCSRAIDARLAEIRLNKGRRR